MSSAVCHLCLRNAHCACKECVQFFCESCDKSKHASEDMKTHKRVNVDTKTVQTTKKVSPIRPKRSVSFEDLASIGDTASAVSASLQSSDVIDISMPQIKASTRSRSRVSGAGVFEALTSEIERAAQVVRPSASQAPSSTPTTNSSSGNNNKKKKEAPPRKAWLNKSESHNDLGYADNTVITSKYTFLTFFPLTLFSQFRRLANIYFLLVSALQLFTNLSPTSKYTTAGPLAVVIAFSMLREAYEDFKRHRADNEVNNRPCAVLRREEGGSGFSWELVPSRDVQVGDIILLKEKEEVLADVILLSANRPDGSTYVDTQNLDGENNLKLRKCLTATLGVESKEGLGKLEGEFEYQPPGKDLYSFTGTLALSDGSRSPVDLVNTIWRGATLSNTKYAHGFVIFTGRESRIMMNSLAATSKRSNVEIVVNQTLVIVFGLELLFCLIGAIFYGVWTKTNQAAWYVPFVADEDGKQAALGFLTFFILFNNFVPISLYVTMEFVKMVQALQIDSDLEMYDEMSDTPALARTSNLNEELGQVDYIFSDKTGTLTCNEMEFRKCSIRGIVYGYGTTDIGLAAIAAGRVATTPKYFEEDMSFGSPAIGSGSGSMKSSPSNTTPGTPVPRRKSTIARRNKKASDAHAAEMAKLDARKAQVHFNPRIAFDDARLLHRLGKRGPEGEAIHEFLICLSVAHTIVPDGNPTVDELVYQGESPDEVALVSAAKCLGYFFVGRGANTITVNVNGKDKHFEILCINPFNSTRKRMSVACRKIPSVQDIGGTGPVTLYVKGADIAVFPLLIKEDFNEKKVTHQLNEFGEEGLRTLVLAKRVIPYETWIDLQHAHSQAQLALENREEEISRVAESMEKFLSLVGTTAIEDKLQKGVPQSIATLAAAGINIWVLTGDKEETAINIGYACSLLTSKMEILIVNLTTVGEVSDKFNSLLRTHKEHIGKKTEHLALVIGGPTLMLVSESETLKQQLLVFARMCKAVIAYRVSPRQKAEMVNLVKYGIKPTPLTLAIGDGANDVPMITEAHVGIGISGKEGMQAVRSSDYAIAQFRFLTRLLLFHGRNNYRRISVVILYSFYKNCALVCTLFFFCIFNGWSGTTLLHSYISATYNVIYTSLPVVIYGILNKDLKFESLVAFPQLYQEGQKNEAFNRTAMARWMFNGLFHGAALFHLVAFSLFSATKPDGRTEEGIFQLGQSVGFALVTCVNLRLALEVHNWTLITATIFTLSVVVYVLVILVLSSLFSLSSDLFNLKQIQFESGNSWAGYILAVAFCFVCDLCLQEGLLWKNQSPAVSVRERQVMLKNEETELEEMDTLSPIPSPAPLLGVSLGVISPAPAELSSAPPRQESDQVPGLFMPSSPLQDLSLPWK